MLRVVSDNRDELPFAWRVLNHGVCDGCALGTTGLKDWTIDGVHLCMVRLELMRLNTTPALHPQCLAHVSSLAGMNSRDLRALRPGRAKIDRIKPGNMQVHWPEGSCLLAREEFDVASREPD